MKMGYLVHTANPQLVALWMGMVGWTLTLVTIGLVQWRIWVVDDVSIITSGLAWVGIWRACFFSHTKVTSQYEIMFCQKIALSDPSTPVEIAVAQVLMLLALILGIVGNAFAVYGLRNIYFGLDEQKPIYRAFSVGGALFILAGVSSSLPLLWNLNSVVSNHTIHFPPNFNLPPAPVRQYIGAGIAVGISASVMVFLSGIIFLSYRFPVRPNPKVLPYCPERGQFGASKAETSPPGGSRMDMVCFHGKDNIAFQLDEKG